MSFKSILVVISLALSVAIGFTLRGAKGTTEIAGATARKIKVGLSLDTLKEARWQVDKDMFEARCKELGMDCRTESANSDDNQQILNCTSLLTGGVDVLVIAAHNGEVMAKAVDMAHQANPPVPVIAYDRMIMNSEPDLYMSFDNVNVGRQQAQFLIDKLPKLAHKPMKIVRIFGAKSDNNALLFKRGQDEVLEPHIKNGDIQVLLEDWAEDWKLENAEKITDAALTKFGHDVDAVLASNDGTAGGAIQALTKEGLAGKVLVTGQDAELVACQRIVQGTQSMTIFKPLKALATRAADLAFALAKHKPVVATQTVNNGKTDVPTVAMDTVIVTKDNIDDTVVKAGMQTHEAIFGK